MRAILRLILKGKYMLKSGAEYEKANEAKAYEAAGKLDEIFLGDLKVLEKAIRYMGANTRETLKRAMDLAERRLGGKE